MKYDLIKQENVAVLKIDINGIEETKNRVEMTAANDVFNPLYSNYVAEDIDFYEQDQIDFAEIVIANDTLFYRRGSSFHYYHWVLTATFNICDIIEILSNLSSSNDITELENRLLPLSISREEINQEGRKVLEINDYEEVRAE